MFVFKMKLASRTMALSLVAGVLLAGCSSNDSDSTADPVGTQSAETTDAGAETGETGAETSDSGNTDTGNTGTRNTDAMTTDFDGTWRSECKENRLIDVDEEDQPDGYVQSTLTIDSVNKSYSERTLLYTDSQCTLEDPDDATLRGSSGEIIFDGVTTTSSGMVATVARYNPNGTSPATVGLLYRDGDILYRDFIESTLIEDIVPTDLSLSNPWYLVN